MRMRAFAALPPIAWLSSATSKQSRPWLPASPTKFGLDRPKEIQRSRTSDAYDGVRGQGSKDRALAALRRLQPSAAAEALANAIQAKSIAVRRWAAAELSREKDGAKPLIAALASDESPAVRWAASMSLAQFQGSEVVQALSKALEDGDGRVRRAAADSLAQIGDKTAIPALVQRVADDVWIEAPAQVPDGSDEPYDGYKGQGSKDHALAALRQLEPAKASEALAAALQSTKPELRRWSAGELGVQKDRTALKALVQTTGDADPATRGRAIAGLANFKDKEAVTALARALEDKEPMIRRAAADSLKVIGDRSATVVNALVKRIADEAWFARPANAPDGGDEPYDGYKGQGSKDRALAALKSLAPERVKDALTQATRSKNVQVKEWAAAELKKIR
jgi:HEAT repeat protein